MFPFFTEKNWQFSTSAKSISLQQTTKTCSKKTHYPNAAQPNPYFITTRISRIDMLNTWNVGFLHQNTCIILLEGSNADINTIVPTELMAINLHFEGLGCLPVRGPITYKRPHSAIKYLMHIYRAF